MSTQPFRVSIRKAISSAAFNFKSVRINSLHLILTATANPTFAFSAAAFGIPSQFQRRVCGGRIRANRRCVPVAGDYDADLVTDIAIFRPSNGAWYLLRASLEFTAAGFGQNGDRAVPGDYDNDGKTDLAVYRSGTGYVILSGSNSFSSTAFGIASGAPGPAAYLP